MKKMLLLVAVLLALSIVGLDFSSILKPILDIILGFIKWIGNLIAGLF